ncbi:type II toxin-antitoxin system prevent-host-death family antitoxin [Roseomonas sp. CAU 1739]|uniref:type II toxin-antitoxin system Phd/YefM family antitoxin n=1 Tax=Roseomonas sp. CAU 1739 TaxID=3140364 RepID=UPI00325AD405
MDETHTVNATEFKAKCLDMLDRVGTGEWESVAITKRGKVVAVLVPPPPAPPSADGLHGFLRGSVQVSEGVDLTAPVNEDGFLAEDGVLHG